MEPKQFLVIERQASSHDTFGTLALGIVIGALYAIMVSKVILQNRLNRETVRPTNQDKPNVASL